MLPGRFPLWLVGKTRKSCPLWTFGLQLPSCWCLSFQRVSEGGKRGVGGPQGGGELLFEIRCVDYINIAMISGGVKGRWSVSGFWGGDIFCHPGAHLHDPIRVCKTVITDVITPYVTSLTSNRYEWACVLLDFVYCTGSRWTKARFGWSSTRNYRVLPLSRETTPTLDASGNRAVDSVESLLLMIVALYSLESRWEGSFG